MAAKTAKGRRRETPVTPRYTRRGPALRVGTTLKVVLRRDRRRLPAVSLDELCEHVNWERSGSSRTGELNFRKPLGSRGVELLLSGDVVELWVAPFNSTRWRRAWRMKVATPRHQIAEGMLSVSLKSTVAHLDDQKVAWKIKAGRRAHQVARQAARRFRLPVGRLAAGRHRLPRKLMKKASVEKVVDWAYREEREQTGRRFNIDTSRGVLEVLELRYPRYAVELGDAIMDVDVDHSLGDLASAVIVTSSSLRGKRSKRKIRVKVVDRGRLKRYGYIVKTVEKKGLRTVAEARRWGKKHLARTRRPHKDLTFTHPGIPWLDRGDAVRVNLRKEENLVTVGFVKAVRHTASAGSYEMEVTAGVDDPYRDAAKARAKKKRQNAARRRGRPGAGAVTAPKTAKAARRS